MKITLSGDEKGNHISPFNQMFISSCISKFKDISRHLFIFYFRRLSPPDTGLDRIFFFKENIKKVVDVWMKMACSFQSRQGHSLSFSVQPLILREWFTFSDQEPI